MHGPYRRWLYVQTFILSQWSDQVLPSALVTTYFPLRLKSTPVMGALWPRREQTSHGCENACFDSFFFSNRCFFPAPFCFFAACALLFVSFTSTNYGNVLWLFFSTRPFPGTKLILHGPTILCTKRQHSHLHSHLSTYGQLSFVGHWFTTSKMIRTARCK